MTQFPRKLFKLKSSSMEYSCKMSDCYRWIKTQAHCSYSSSFYPFLFSFHILHVNNEFVSVFSGSIGSRLLELGLYMDDELLYHGIDNQAHY